MLNAGAHECHCLPLHVTRAPATIAERFTVFERRAPASLVVRLRRVSARRVCDLRREGVGP